jgi:hypothetical protein
MQDVIDVDALRRCFRSVQHNGKDENTTVLTDKRAANEPWDRCATRLYKQNDPTVSSSRNQQSRVQFDEQTNQPTDQQLPAFTEKTEDNSKERIPRRGNNPQEPIEPQKDLKEHKENAGGDKHEIEELLKKLDVCEKRLGVYAGAYEEIRLLKQENEAHQEKGHLKDEKSWAWSWWNKG